MADSKVVMWKGALLASRAVLGDECKARLVASLVDDFIQMGDGWTFVRAVNHGYKRLIARIGLSRPYDDNAILVRHQDVNDALIVALRINDVEAAKLLVQACNWVRITKAITYAAAHGQVTFLQWLKDCDAIVCWGGNEMQKVGHLETLQWLQDNTVRLQPQRLLGLAARHHSPDMLRWVITVRNETPMIVDLQCAAERGCLANLKTLFGLMPTAPQLSAMGAVAGGHVEVVMWLKQNGGVFAKEVVDVAAENGHLHMVQYLHEHKLGECSIGAIEMAAHNGHQHIVKWIVMNQPRKLWGRAMIGALAGVNMKIARWLHENVYTVWAGRLVDVAAQFLDCDDVAWTLQHFPHTATTNAMDNAARANRDDVFLFLHYNGGVECTTSAMDFFAANGNLRMVQWLHTNRVEGCTSKAMDVAAEEGHLEMIKWLHANRQEGCTTRAIDRAAGNGHLEVVSWLHENRQEGCTTEAMDFAAQFRHLSVLKWLHKHRTEGCTEAALDYAASEGFLDVLIFLHETMGVFCSRRASVLAADQGHLEVVHWLSVNCWSTFDVDAVRRAAPVHGWSSLVLQDICRM